jgi:DnaJ-class molecular chaperone
MAKKKEMVRCPDCGGSGSKSVGRSVAMNEAIRHGFPSTYGCECCGGTGKVEKGTDPDWWKISDNASGGR